MLAGYGLRDTLLGDDSESIAAIRNVQSPVLEVQDKTRSAGAGNVWVYDGVVGARAAMRGHLPVRVDERVVQLLVQPQERSTQGIGDVVDERVRDPV